jgi:hypothetical protein
MVTLTPLESALVRLRRSPPLPLWASLIGSVDRSAIFTAALLTGYLASNHAKPQEVADFAKWIAQFQTPAAMLHAVWGPDKERG